MPTILVVGATGLLGSDICRQLIAEGKSVRALVRSTSDPAKVEKLKSLGAEIIQGDVRDRDSLDRACNGVTAVISTVSAMPFSYQAGVNDLQNVDLEGLINLIEAAKVERLKSLGAEIFQGDVRDRDSLDRACNGVTAVISTVSAMPFSYQAGVNDLQRVDLEGLINLIEAAKANQVTHFVYTSVSANALRVECPLVDAKSEVERRLKESGLTYTILHPSAFMEVWLGPAVGFDAANGKVVIYGTGQNPISWIAVNDLTQFAVTSLDHPGAKNVTIELGGPEAISPLDAVRFFEDAYGRPIELQFVPVEALKAQEAAATDPMQKTFSVLMQFIAAGDPIEMSDTYKTFDIRPTSLEEYVSRVSTPA